MLQFNFKSHTYYLFRRQIEQSRSQNGRCEKSQKYKTGYDRISYFFILREIDHSALFKIVEDLTHQRRTFNGALRDCLEYALDVTCQIGQIGLDRIGVANAGRIDLARFPLIEDQVDGWTQGFVEVL